MKLFFLCPRTWITVAFTLLSVNLWAVVPQHSVQNGAGRLDGVGPDMRGEGDGTLPPLLQHDLTPMHDPERVLLNPHKGWYHHDPDNHINKYGALWFSKETGQLGRPGGLLGG